MESALTRSDSATAAINSSSQDSAADNIQLQQTDTKPGSSATSDLKQIQTVYLQTDYSTNKMQAVPNFDPKITGEKLLIVSRAKKKTFRQAGQAQKTTNKRTNKKSRTTGRGIEPLSKRRQRMMITTTPTGLVIHISIPTVKACKAVVHHMLDMGTFFVPNTKQRKFSGHRFHEIL